MITVTDQALQKLKEILAQEGKEGFAYRLIVQEGCCSYTCGLYFDKEAEPGDRVVELDGLRFFVDPVSAPFLEGAVIDFKELPKGAGFVIQAPGLQKEEGGCSCGCGH